MSNGNDNHHDKGCASGKCGDTGKDHKQMKQFPSGEDLIRRMSRIKHKIVVLSGKGGVGKSTVAVNMAVALALSGKRVGLLDIDVHGPSIPKLLHLEKRAIQATDAGIIPTGYGNNLKVMSIGFLLRQDNEAVIWRGPMKYGVIKQFLEDVVWGELDFLIVDSPPGTGDEPLSIAQLIKESGGGIQAVIVTTPQELALSDVRKSISFCQQLSINIIGVVENMSGFVCPHCGKTSEIFKTGGGEHVAREMRVPFLGKVPIDPQVVNASDEGKPYLYHYAKTETAQAFSKVITPILEMDLPVVEPAVSAINEEKLLNTPSINKDGGKMRIAIPIANNRLSMHFGHCEHFALIDVDTETKEILRQDSVEAPEHEPGLFPVWLKEKGADLIIAGGMGSRAQGLFAQNGVRVITGAVSEEPRRLVEAYLAGTLQTGENVCDH